MIHPLRRIFNYSLTMYNNILPYFYRLIFTACLTLLLVHLNTFEGAFITN